MGCIIIIIIMSCVVMMWSCWCWWMMSEMMMWWWWLLTVKYLREVTPYFRKTSSSWLNDVGWTDDTKFTSERAIPLRLCYVCRADDLDSVRESGSGGSHSLELHSPDRRSSCLLRCPDEDTATQWLTAVCNVIASLTTRAITDVNAKLSITSNGTSSPHNNNIPLSLGSDVKHLGWLTEQVLVSWVKSVDWDLCGFKWNSLLSAAVVRCPCWIFWWWWLLSYAQVCGSLSVNEIDLWVFSRHSLVNKWVCFSGVVQFEYITWLLSGFQWFWESIMEASVCSCYNDRVAVVRCRAIKLWRVVISSQSAACRHCH